VANGGFKIGFGLAPLVGERMADLVLSGKADLPPEWAP
jgi:glycine oxidase